MNTDIVSRHPVEQPDDDAAVSATVLLMERAEMLDTVIAAHHDSNRRRRSGFTSLCDAGYRYLIAKNRDDEGFFLVWDGPEHNRNLTEDVYEAIAEEAQRASLVPPYHVYARLYVFQTDNIRFYQTPAEIRAWLSGQAGADAL